MRKYPEFILAGLIAAFFLAYSIRAATNSLADTVLMLFFYFVLAGWLVWHFLFDSLFAKRNKKEKTR